jgi:hypothetical protein
MSDLDTTFDQLRRQGRLRPEHRADFATIYRACRGCRRGRGLMIATEMFATPTAAVLFDNGQPPWPAQLRLANITGSGDVRLSGTPTG